MLLGVVGTVLFFSSQSIIKLANLFARAINHRGVLIHGVTTAAIDSIVIRGEAKFLRRRQRLTAKTKVLYSLADGFGNVEFVSDAFGDVEVVGGNLFVDQLA